MRLFQTVHGTACEGLSLIPVPAGEKTGKKRERAARRAALEVGSSKNLIRE